MAIDKVLAASNLDASLRLWDARTGRNRHVLSGHEAGCTGVAFSPDGKRLASSDA